MRHFYAPTHRVEPECLSGVEFQVRGQERIPWALPFLVEKQAYPDAGVGGIQLCVVVACGAAVFHIPVCAQPLDYVRGVGDAEFGLVFGIVHFSHSEEMAFYVPAVYELHYLGAGEPAIYEEVVEGYSH